jgi:hypothetical protein
VSVYSYPQSKVIDEITFKKSEGGHVRAYLHAAPGADPKLLHAIACDLAERGWQATPFSMGRKPLLEVEGFGTKATSLVNLLQEKQWVQGEAKFVADKEDKLSLKEQVKKRSLAASGAFYLIGDGSFAKYGYEGGSSLNLAAGALYGAGTLSLLGFGRKDQSDLQVKDIARKMREHFKKLDDKLPESCSLESISEDHKKGLIRSADDLFRRYPSEMMNLFFAAAGVCIAIAAKNHMKSPMEPKDVTQVFTRLSKKQPGLTEAMVKHKMEINHRRESWLDIGLGSMTSLSGLFAMLVKEKHPDPDAPKKHGLEAVWQKIQQKPLAIAGAGYMVSTMCHAVSTGIAWNYANDKRRSSVKWRALFVGSNIVAEILLAISSKGHGHGVKSDKSVDNTVISLAAELIAKQPAAMQNTLIDHVTGFLGRPDTLALKDNEVKAMLRTEVELMRKNPWAMAASKGQSASVTQSVSAQQIENKAQLSWQAKAALAEKASNQPHLSV